MDFFRSQRRPNKKRRPATSWKDKKRPFFNLDAGGDVAGGASVKEGGGGQPQEAGQPHRPRQPAFPAPGLPRPVAVLAPHLLQSSLVLHQD